MAELKANFFEGEGDGVQDGALPGAEPERTETGEGTESDLFAELGGSESDDGDEESLFSDEDGEATDDGDNGTKAQLQRLRRQRTELRSAKQRLEEQVASISAQLDASREMAKVITDRYAKYDNPAAMVSFDADFMEAMESLKDQVPEIPKVADIVRKKMEGKNLFTAEPTPEAKPVEDPRVAKLLEAHARDRVTAVLTDLKIKPTLQRTVAKEVLARIENKEDITRNDVLRSLQGAMESEGWTEGDIRTVAPKKKPAPDVGKPRQAVTTGSADTGSDDERKAAKTKSEWDANREGLFRSFEQSLQ